MASSFHPLRWAAAVFVGLPILWMAIAGISTIAGPGESSRTLLRTLRYLLAAELAFLVAISLFGAVYQAASRHRDRELYHPPGKLVDVGGYRLHLYCSGEGGPTVVLDFGLDGSYLDWYRVQPEIARFTRVCSYDRAGYGWSDSAPRPRLPSVMAEEMRQLLTAAGEKPPYILVGHSFGSFNVLMYAHQHPREVSGLVLVDGAHPDERLPFYLKKKIWLRMMQFTMPFGLPRWRGWCGAGPPEIANMKVAIGCRSQVYATTYAQWRAFPQSADEIRKLGSLGSMPLVVISRDPNRKSIGDDVVSAQREQHWLKLQEQLVGLSSHATRVIAEGSGHSVPVQRPDVIVAAVRKLISQVR
jgi:pimeloyl-ACP methyl ester carboxylesterase